MKIYIGNKMMGIRQFNFPWFDDAAFSLRKLGIEVFNPAERDRKAGFYPATDCMGTVEDMEALNFSRRGALAVDWAWIAANSDGMVAGPDWRKSTGTVSEIACHQALGLPVWEFDVFVRNYVSARISPEIYALPPLLELGNLELGNLELT